MTEIALIGKKIGMSREFYKTGQSIPVTVIKMEKGRIIDLIQEEKRGTYFSYIRASSSSSSSSSNR